MAKIVKKISSWFTGLDKFGHPITVFFKGGDVYQTKLGALLSICVYALVLGYLGLNLLSLVDMSDPNITIIRKNLTRRQLEEFLPINLAENQFNMAVIVIDKSMAAIDMPAEIGRFVLKPSPDTIAELEPCLDLIPKQVLKDSLPVVEDQLNSGKAYCVPASTEVTSFLGGTDHNLNLSFLECSKDPAIDQKESTCKTDDDIKAWLEEHAPVLKILTQKRLIDFFLKEDYSYSKMAPFLQKPIVWGESIVQGMSMYPINLTVHDGLINPFDQLTEESDYLMAEKIDLDFLPPTFAGGINVSISLMLSDEMGMHSRQRYNYWQALGDIGGFHDGLVLVINIIMASYSSGMFEQKLVDGDRYYKRGRNNSQQESQRVQLARRLQDENQKQPVSVNNSIVDVFNNALQSIKKVKGSSKSCVFDYIICCSRSKRERQRAKESILDHYQRELDVQTLVESNVNMRQAIHFLFTKQQRVILAHQAGKYPDGDTSSSDDPFKEKDLKKMDFPQTLTELNMADPMTKKLLVAVLLRKPKKLDDRAMDYMSACSDSAYQSQFVGQEQQNITPSHPTHLISEFQLNQNPYPSPYASPQLSQRQSINEGYKTQKTTLVDLEMVEQNRPPSHLINSKNQAAPSSNSRQATSKESKNVQAKLLKRNLIRLAAATAMIKNNR